MLPIVVHVKDPIRGCQMAVVQKEFIQHYYIEKNYSRAEIYKLGVSSKIFINSYMLYYSSEERKHIGNAKISRSQRKENSNLKNSGKPRIIIDKQIIEQYLKDGKTTEYIAKQLKVAPQTIRGNINYHNIQLTEDILKRQLFPVVVSDMIQLDKMFGTDLLQLHKGTGEREVQEILDALYIVEMGLKDLRVTINHLRQNIVDYAKRQKIVYTNKRTPLSFLNYYMGKAIEEIGYPVEYEYCIENKYYDLAISGTKVLIEVDNIPYHSKKKATLNDIEKNKIAKRNGYKLLRIQSDKDTYSQMKEKAKKCLQKAELLV